MPQLWQFINEKGFRLSKITTKRGLISRKTQRFICKDCHKSFVHNSSLNRSRFSQDLKDLVVKDYVTTKSSLSEVSNRYNVTTTSILNWLRQRSSTTSSILSLNINMVKSGLIQIDGKEIKVGKKKKTLLVACDNISKIPFYYKYCDGENKKESRLFLKGLKRVYKNPVRGIVSDFGRGKCFVGVVQDIFPNIPHQICIVHFLRYIWMFLPKTKKSKYYWRNYVLRWIIKKVVCAPTRKESLYWLKIFKRWIPFFRAQYHKRFVRSLLRNYHSLTMYYEHQYLAKTTNIIENFNRQLERKLKNFDGFKTEKNIKPFLKIWFHNYIYNNKNRPL